MADFSERMASLNTQMRFKRWKEAMPIAYSLRLDLQLAQPQTAKLLESLKVVEDIIEQLEKTRVTRWARFVKKVQHTIDPSSREDEAEEEEEEEEEEGGEDSSESADPGSER